MYSVRRSSQGSPVEGFRTVVLEGPHRFEADWYNVAAIGVVRRGTAGRPYGEIAVGPGWARLVTRLEHRLRREGYRRETLPRHLTTGAGELSLAIPTRAPHEVHRAAQALSRMALRCCEICLRGPTEPMSVELPTLRETLRLCDWHAARLYGVKSIAQLRSEAWGILRHGDGALRAWLLGARLTPAGIADALQVYACSVPTLAQQDGWIWPDLVAHALTRLQPGTLARVPAAALLPLLNDEVQAVREAAILAITCTQTTAAGGDGRAVDGLGAANSGTAEETSEGASLSASSVQRTHDESALGHSGAVNNAMPLAECADA